MANYDSYGFNKDKTKYDLTQISEMIEKQVQNGFNNLLNAAWPVGSVWISADGSSPSDHNLPGTWKKLPAGYYLGTHAGVDPGTTGGSNSFTLTTAQLPRHSHKITYSRENLGSRFAQFERIRLIDYNTGGTSGNTPAKLPMQITIRRGPQSSATGGGTTMMNESGILEKQPQKGTDAGKVIVVRDPTSDEEQKGWNKWDVFSVNFTDKFKIDGWTEMGIYNTASESSISQQPITYSPQYIRVDVYVRQKDKT